MFSWHVMLNLLKKMQMADAMKAAICMWVCVQCKELSSRTNWYYLCPANQRRGNIRTIHQSVAPSVSTDLISSDRAREQNYTLFLESLHVSIFLKSTWWLAELPSWFKASFHLEFWEFFVSNMQKIIPCMISYKPYEIRYQCWSQNTQKNFGGGGWWG